MYDLYPDEWRGAQEPDVEYPSEKALNVTMGPLIRWFDLLLDSAKRANELDVEPAGQGPELDERHYDWCRGSCGGSCERSMQNLGKVRTEDLRGL